MNAPEAPKTLHFNAFEWFQIELIKKEMEKRENGEVNGMANYSSWMDRWDGRLVKSIAWPFSKYMFTLSNLAILFCLHFKENT